MKITEYESTKKLSSENVMIVDGPEGTRKVDGSELPYSIMHLTGAPTHRKIFRGKNLGETFSVEQKAAVQNGSFEDLWIGDYWTISGINFRIADFDYWYGVGDTPFNQHHLVIVPDEPISDIKMNESDTTTGGYTGCTGYTTAMTDIKSTIEAAFEYAVLDRREYLVNAISGNMPSAGNWYDSKVEFMNEPMVYGGYIQTPASSASNVSHRTTCSKSQLALFSIAPRYMICQKDYWLRDVVSSTAFASVSKQGLATFTNASTQIGARPVFAIG